MTALLQTWLAKFFENYAHFYASSLNCGIFNYVFVPYVNETRNETLLGTVDFNVSNIIASVTNIMFKPAQSLDVWSVLPEISQFGPVRNNTYWLLITITCIVGLVAFLSVCTLISLPCATRKCYNRLASFCSCSKIIDNGLTNNNEEFTTDHLYENCPQLTDVPNIAKQHTTRRRNICTPVVTRKSMRAYLILGIVCALLLFVLFSVAILTFYTFIPLSSTRRETYLRSTNNSQSSDLITGTLTQSNLVEAINFVLNEVQLFLKEIVPNGELRTNQTAEMVNATFVENLRFLVNDIMLQLLESYKVKTLMLQAEVLRDSLTILQATTDYIDTNAPTVLGNMTQFQGAMKGYQNSIRNALQDLCTKLTAATTHAQCISLKDRVSILTFTFNSSEVFTEPSTVLSGVVNVFGINLTEIINSFSKLQQELDKQAASISGQVSKQFDVNTMFEPIRQLWIKLDERVKPIIQSIETNSLLAQNVASIYHMVLIGLGYIFLITCTLLLASFTVYLLIYGTESHERALLSGISSPTDADEHIPQTLEGTVGKTYAPVRQSPKCVYFSTATWAVPLFLAIISSSIVIVTDVVITNDVCRYGILPAGQNQTDAILNLFLKSVWPNLIDSGRLSPDTMKLLQLPTPTNVFQAILLQCGPTSTGQTEAAIGLLPLVGLRNIINVTAIVSSPQVENAVKQNEDTLVKEIMKVNFASYLPDDIDGLFGTIANITFYLDTADYTNSISQLTGAPWNFSEVNSYLANLKSFSAPYVETFSEAKSIANTIEAVNAKLTSYDDVIQKANQLGQAFIRLQEQRTLTKQLNDIRSSLSNVKKVLSNTTLVEAPIRPAYQLSTKTFLTNLSMDLEVKMSQFTENLIICNRLYTALQTIVQTVCGDVGAINRMGAFCFSLIAFAIIMLFMMICYQFFVYLHEKHCLYHNNQGIPMYLFVKYVYQTKFLKQA